MHSVLGLFTLALIGAGVANVLSHPTADKVVLDSLGNFYKTGTNGMLGKAS